MKRIAIIIITQLMFTLSVIAQTAVVPAGSGTQADPFQIATLENLYWLSGNSESWDKHFIQTEDIDASATSAWNHDGLGEYYGFSPIGSFSIPFIGNYNGQNHTISNLYINRAYTYYIGLFGYTQVEAKIENLGLIDCDIEGKWDVGGLVGRSESSTINNCYSTGSVSGTYFIGGLVGYKSNGIINGSYSTGSVSGKEAIGGLVGKNFSGTISNCYSTGSVSGGEGSYGIGGLVGDSESGTIRNSYSTGLVIGNSSVGGFLGIGGTAYVISCFWDIQTSGQATSDRGTGKTTYEMKKYGTYINAGWDFIEETDNGSNNYWGINSSGNNGYPFLAWQGYTHSLSLEISTQNPSNILLTSATLNGRIDLLGAANITKYGFCWSTSQNPTVSDSITDKGSRTTTGPFTSSITGLLAGTTYYVRAYATDANGTNYGEQVHFTTPLLGAGTNDNPFQISLLEHLRTVSENSDYWDKYLIQTADIDASATSTWNPDGHGDYYGFSPIGNSGIKFTGNYNGQGHTISNLYIKLLGINYVGFFGNTSGAVIKNIALVDCNIIGHIITGALVGAPENSTTVENCFTTGTIEGENIVGGLVGINYASSSISNCYSRASVTGNDKVAGLVGSNEMSSTINFSYSTGSITGNSNVGGFVGTNTATISNCFWDTETSNLSTSAGGTGKTTDEMKKYSTYISVSAGWDFTRETTNGTDDIWDIDKNGSVNDGYPFFTGETIYNRLNIYVNCNAGGSNNGTTWTDAFTSFQSALENVISGDEIWVAKGLYYPSKGIDGTDKERENFFRLKNGVNIYGGFAGNETYVSQRSDFGIGGSNETIASGDRGVVGIKTDNCYYVFCHPSEFGLDNTAVLDGFTIRDGYGNGMTWGGGMINNGCSPTLNNCTFTNNSADQGGAIYNANCSPKFVNCLIINNISLSNGSGIYNDNSSPTIINTTISGNNSPAFGGGLFNKNSAPVITNCIIWGNNAAAGGSNIYTESGQPVFSYSNIQGSGGSSSWYSGLGSNGGNNIDTDPCFLGSGNYTITGQSPCLDKGDNDAISLSTDIRGGTYSRKLNCISGEAGTVDIGAYEYKAGNDPLPVELTDFTALVNNDKIVLNWETATEVNNYGFEVERATYNEQLSVNNWEKIGFIAGHGNSNSPKQYEFVDSELPADSLKYRLKQIDTDGSFKYYYLLEKIDGVVTNIGEESLPKEYSLKQNYPNPFNPTTTIDVAIPNSGNFKLAVYNILGELVATLFNDELEVGYHSFEFDASKLSSGIYIYNFQGRGENFSKKMSLMK